MTRIPDVEGSDLVPRDPDVLSIGDRAAARRKARPSWPRATRTGLGAVCRRGTSSAASPAPSTPGDPQRAAHQLRLPHQPAARHPRAWSTWRTPTGSTPTAPSAAPASCRCPQHPVHRRLLPQPDPAGAAGPGGPGGRGRGRHRAPPGSGGTTTRSPSATRCRATRPRWPAGPTTSTCPRRETGPVLRLRRRLPPRPRSGRSACCCARPGSRSGLMNDQWCCGVALEMGYTDIFEQFARRNLEDWRQAGAKRVVTLDPRLHRLHRGLPEAVRRLRHRGAARH